MICPPLSMITACAVTAEDGLGENKPSVALPTQIIRHYNFSNYVKSIEISLFSGYSKKIFFDD